MREIFNIKAIEKFIFENKLSKIKFCKLCHISLKSFDKIISSNKYQNNNSF